MTQSPDEDAKKYGHSPVHYAVACKDHSTLKQILASLPCLPRAGEVVTERDSFHAEEKAETVSLVIDRRDVPGRETPLHLAVKRGDSQAVEMLMVAGADWSLQNEQGWSALQEAVCAREDGIAMIISRHYQPMAWAKWCRRLPRITAAMRRMRNFYMEITFHFESAVIPFIGRIAPSDTYRIWKRGSNLRADMTLAGFDGMKIQRAEQSYLFLGDGSQDGTCPPGSLLVLTHKEKEVTDALEGAGMPPTEAEIAHEIASMSRTNMYRPGVDVTQAELTPQVSWRRQERSELVGPWKAKVYDMNNVVFSVRSRRVPGAVTDDELLNANGEKHEEEGHHADDATDFLTEEEKLQLENAWALGLGEETFEGDHARNSCYKHEEDFHDGKAVAANGVEAPGSSKEDKRDWLPWRRKIQKQEQEKRNSLHIESNGKVGSNRLSNAMDSSRICTEGRMSDFCDESMGNVNKEKEKVGKRAGGVKTKKGTSTNGNGNAENEFKKGLRPVLWLTRDFPLKTEELLPLFDILANKVKAIRRLRELLTTKLPPGTFPVKIAIPVVPTIRVVVTFTRFEELRSSQGSSTLSSQEEKAKDCENMLSSSSWLSWIRGQQSEEASVGLPNPHEVDPFTIPSDYMWIDMNEKRRRMKLKHSNKVKKGKKSLTHSAGGQMGTGGGG